jgi:uncharacterized repeat protein (TIGR03806 family)
VFKYSIFLFFIVSSIVSCGGSDSSSPSTPTVPSPTIPAPTIPTPPIPLLSVSNVGSVEGNQGRTQLTINFMLAEASSSIIGFNYSTEDIDAVAGEDYIAQSGQLQIAAGQLTVDLQIVLIGDVDIESDEAFAILLSNPEGVSFANTQATITILNDDSSEALSGLSNRPSNQNCLAGEQPTGSAEYELVQIFEQLDPFNLPVKMLKEPESNRWFVLEKNGVVKVFEQQNPIVTEVYLDLTPQVNSASEGGLLGIAFHPQYPDINEIFIYYTAHHSDPSMRSVVSRLVLDFNGSSVQYTEQIIIEIDQDFNNHNGGDIAFGADNYLYIGLGDGGSGGDPNNRAQDTRYLLGSMLRIDVLGGDLDASPFTYHIPTDNPFSDNPRCGPGANQLACPEIYAWGLRNPWRWSFDRQTGDLWLADVGQNQFEEINKIRNGGNYGWRCKEANSNFNLLDCDDNLVTPIASYSHELGNSVTGGFVYRGNLIPQLRGKYVFADYGSGRVWSIQSDQQGQQEIQLLVNANNGISSFALDDQGEILLTNLPNGQIYQLRANNQIEQNPVPDKLSETGCIDLAETDLNANGLIPYTPAVPFWSDGLSKDRFMALPDDQQLVFSAQDNWQFPIGSVLTKHFSYGQKRIETRLMKRHMNGNWAGYVYQWNDEQTEAMRVRGGKNIELDGASYRIPSEDECLACHTVASGFVLGAETAQLNSDLLYTETAQIANQVDTFTHIDLFSNPPALPIEQLENFQQTDINSRARAYLHVNCAGCHQSAGPTSSDLDLRYTVPLTNVNGCLAPPQFGNLGVENGLIIDPGAPALSILLNRMSTRGANAMPLLGSLKIDQTAIALISEWIDQMTGCD